MVLTLHYIKGAIKEDLPITRIEVGETLIIGREKSVDFNLKRDRSVSSRHASITVEEDGAYIFDLESRNGTFVNGNRVKKSELQDVDIIQIGSCLFKVKLVQPSDNEVDEEFTWEEKAVGDTSTLRIAGAEQFKGGFTNDSKEEKEFCFEDSLHFGSEKPSVVPEEKLDFKIHLGSPANEDSLAEHNAKRQEPVVRAELVGMIPRRLQVKYELPEGGTGSVIVKDNQIVSIGKGSLSDFQLSDSDLEILHLKFQIINGNPRLINQSRSGTYLNGRRIEKEALADGDVVIAGRTQFHVSLSGFNNKDAETEVEPSGDSDGEDRSDKIPQARDRANRIVGQFTCLVNPIKSASRAVEIIEGLSQDCSYYVVIDFARSGSHIPSGVFGNSSMILNWMPANSSIFLPHLIAVNDASNWQAFVAEGWGKDSVFGFESHEDHDTLVDGFKSLLKEIGDVDPEKCQGFPSTVANVVQSRGGLPDCLSGKVFNLFVEDQTGSTSRLFSYVDDQSLTYLSDLGFRAQSE